MNPNFVRAWPRMGTSLLLSLSACAQPNAPETRVRTDEPAPTTVAPANGGASQLGGSTSSPTPQLPSASGGAPVLGQSGAVGATAPGAGGATGTTLQTAPSCGSVQIGSELKTTETVIEVPGTVLFVFDQSSSMNEDWNGTPKWSVANAALVAAFTPLQRRLSAGAVLFPTPSADTSTDRCNWLVDWRSCVAAGSSRGGDLCPDVLPISASPQIPIQAGGDFLARWTTLWGQAQAAKGYGTPTEKGLLQAEAALQLPPPGNTAVVLLTDGEPTCGANEDAIAARLLQKGIPTHVVGLPGVNGGAFLDRIALAGGTATPGCASGCYLTPENPATLQSALERIASTTITTMTSRTIQDCSFGLNAPPGADPSSVHLIVSDAVNGQQYQVPQPDGWLLSGSTAVLSPTTCELARAGAFLDLTFQYGCVDVPILPPR